MKSRTTSCASSRCVGSTSLACFEPESLEWRSYWLDVHIPGLRRWAFPLIEGKKPERYRPLYPVRFGRDLEPAPVGQAAE